MKKNLRNAVIGGVSGFFAGFFGSGGGVAVVEGLERAGIEEKQAHATSLAVIFPICAVSAVFYGAGGHVPTEPALWLCGGAAAGGLLGAFCLKRVGVRLLNDLFTLLMLAAGVRLLL